MKNSFRNIFAAVASAIAVFSGICVSAQPKYLNQYMAPEPQTWSFIKYGGLTPDLYTGTVRAVIPVYTYKDPDFEIPVTLSYASNGFMPNVQANNVGLGWSLNAGGCITRRVRGIKDDGTETVDGRTVFGFFQYATRNHSTVPVLDRTIGGTQEMAYYAVGSGASSQLYETESDIYMFSFPGHTGKFVIGDTGNVIVYDTERPSGEYSVILDEYGTSTFQSKITIRTGDGYRFVFGGIESTNYSISHEVEGYDMNVPESGSYFKRDERPDSWMLTSIIAPNGRTVTYGYTVDNTCILENLSPFASRNNYSVSITTGGRRLLRGVYQISETYPTEGYTLQRNYVPRLDSITIDGGCLISFSYGTRESEIGYRTSKTRKALSTPKKLESIAVTYSSGSSSSVITECSLGYRYTSGNPVMLLKDVHIEGSGHYRFTYYNEDSAFPFQGTSRMDHWGYFNSNPDTTARGLLPRLYLENDYSETIIGNNRTPDHTKAIYGMLKKVSYPSGGYTQYSYEPHEYARKVERRSNVNSGKPFLGNLSSAQQAGGLRIKSILNHASTGTETQKIYSYTKDGISSGIVLDFPRYSQVLQLSMNQDYINKCILSTSIPSYLMDRSYIEYSEVTETSADGSSETLCFASYSDAPDNTDDIDKKLIDGTHGNVPHWEVSFPSNSGNLLREYSSCYLVRGMLKKREIRDNQGDVIQSEEMTYAGNAGGYTESVHFSTDSAYALRNYLNDRSLLTVRTIKDGRLVSTATYTYNNRHQLKTRQIADADNTLHKTHLYYPQDVMGAGATNVERQMFNAGVISMPVYVVNTFGKNNNTERIVSATKTLHKQISAGSSQMFVRRAECRMIVPQTSPSAITWGSAKNSVMSMPFKVELSWDKYNSLGRPCEVTDANGVKSSIIWGYKGLYPIALVHNCSNTELVSAGINPLSVSTSGLLPTIESSIRALPGVSVNSWRIAPFIGIRQATGPDGRKMLYGYDKYGRLETVTEANGDKIAEYRYNIVTE